MDIIPQKRCTKCKQEYPATTQYFGRQSTQKDGLKGICKVCYKVYNRKQSEKRGYKPLNRSIVEGDKRQCYKCKTWYPNTTEYFYEAKHSKAGVNTKCIDCVLKYGAEYRAKHPRLKKPKGHGFIKNDERCCSECRKWLPNNSDYFPKNKKGIGGIGRKCKKCRYAKNTDWRRRNPNKTVNYAQNGKKWAKNNPQAVKSMMQRRAAREHNLPDTLTPTEWLHCLEYFNHLCAVCNRPIGLWHTLALDHWIPISNPDCPGTVVKNIIPLCHGVGGCNNSKHNKMPDEWLNITYGKRKAAKILKRIQVYFDSL